MRWAMGLEKGQPGRRPGGSGEVGKEQAGRRPGGAAAAPAPCAGGSRPKGRDGLRPDAGTLQGDADEAGAGGQRGALQEPGGRQRPGEGTLQEPGGPQGNPPGGRVWGRLRRPLRRRSRRPCGPVSSRFGRVQ